LGSGPANSPRGLRAMENKINTNTLRGTSEGNIVPYLKFGIVALLVILLYSPEIRSLFHEWSTKKESSHGFLIPVISIYITWKKRETLRSMLVDQSWEGFLILLSGLFLLLIGRVSHEPSAQQFSLLITISGLVYFLLGRKVFRVLLFPLGYLVFMIPPPYILINTIAIHLRLVDAKMTYFIINSLGIPIIREGPNLHLPDISLDVAYLCTGILSLVSMVALSVVWAYIFLRHVTSRIVLILLALPIAFASNILRISLITLLTYYLGAVVLKSAVHQFQGVVIFMMNILLLLILGSFLKKAENKYFAEKSS
jgi:exosortase